MPFCTFPPVQSIWMSINRMVAIQGMFNGSSMRPWEALVLLDRNQVSEQVSKQASKRGRSRLAWLTSSLTLWLTAVMFAPAQAAPRLMVGDVKGKAGAEILVPVTFDPGGSSVSCVEFEVPLPAGVSKVSV